MKSIIAALALLFAGFSCTASAEQVDLYATAGWGALHQYHNVPTSLCTQTPCEYANTVTIYLPNSGSVNHGIQLWFGSEVNPATGNFYEYWTGTYSGNGLVSVVQKCVFDQSNLLAPCVLNGETMQVTLDETSRTVRGSGSGRGGYASKTYWTLLDGTILR